MTELLDKLESYKIFNYLYPGCLFLGACTYLGISIAQDQNLLITAFEAYFIGMTISRVGSIIANPVFKYFGLVKFKQYEDFVQAEKLDPKIQTLNEESNTFRTVFMTALIVLAAAGIKQAVDAELIAIQTIELITLVLVGVVYALAYRKHVGFIKRRVTRALHE